MKHTGVFIFRLSCSGQCADAFKPFEQQINSENFDHVDIRHRICQRIQIKVCCSDFSSLLHTRTESHNCERVASCLLLAGSRTRTHKPETLILFRFSSSGDWIVQRKKTRKVSTTQNLAWSNSWGGRISQHSAAENTSSSAAAVSSSSSSFSSSACGWRIRLRSTVLLNERRKEKHHLETGGEERRIEKLLIEYK